MSNTHTTTPIATTADADALATTLRAAAHAYYQTDAQHMTDAEYDTGIDTLRAYADANPDWDGATDLLTQVAAGTTPVSGDVIHPTPMLSLAKVTTSEEVTQFLGTVPSAIVEPKLDGLAVRAVYTDGRLTLVATRGNGTTGEDITDRAQTIAGLPTTLTRSVSIEVRGEVFITDADFPLANANRVAAGKPAFVNSRNAVAGALRKKDATYGVPMTFAAYDALGDDLPPSHIARMKTVASLGVAPAFALLPDLNLDRSVLEAIAHVQTHRAELGFPIDGVVIKADDDSVRARLGTTSHSPRWAVAYKYAAETATTTVRAIATSVGRTGRLAIRVEVEPVFVAGTTITYATGHNVSWMLERDIRVGDTVTILRANDVIPYIESVDLTRRPADSVPWEPPATDPMGQEWDKSTLLWRSTSPELSVLGRIVYAAHRDCLDIDGIGTEIATALIEHVPAGADGPLVGDLADLFTLTEDALATLPLGVTSTGATRLLGRATAAKIIAEIEAAKSAPFNRVITALGVRMTGRTMGRRLAAAFPTMDLLLSASVNDLAQVDGIGPKKADVIHEGLGQMVGVIGKLERAGVNMGSRPDEGEAAALPLAGMTVVVTGAMTGPLAGTSRTEMNELIEQAGGKASGSVSAKTSLLVSGEASGSKYAKAQSLGVRIVSPEEFAVMLGR